MLRPSQWHETLTEDRIADACDRYHMSLDNPGFCIFCGFEQDGCEPDARRYKCESCGQKGVYGAEELLLHMS
jgi:hypothetical protein